MGGSGNRNIISGGCLTAQKAKDILIRFNKYRRGHIEYDSIRYTSMEIGLAIDFAIKNMKEPDFKLN